MKVRHWCETDTSSVWRLIRDLAAFEENIDLFKLTEAALLEQGFQSSPPDRYCLVAEENAEIIGILSYVHVPPEGSQPEWMVTDLFVTETTRRQGVGSALMKCVALEATHAGCPLVRWAVADDNEAAKRFYKSLGARANPNWVSYGLDSASLETLAGQT